MHELRFETARFNLSRELDHFLNPGCFGHDAAAWLRWELVLRGVEATPPGQEDWGWYFEVDHGGARYLLGLSGFAADSPADPEHPDWGEWCLVVHKQRSFWQRLLGRGRLVPEEGILVVLREILDSAEDLTPVG